MVVEEEIVGDSCPVVVLVAAEDRYSPEVVIVGDTFLPEAEVAVDNYYFPKAALRDICLDAAAEDIAAVVLRFPDLQIRLDLLALLAGGLAGAQIFH